MIFKLHNLLSVLIMNICQLIPQILIFRYVKIPVIFQFVRYVVEVLNFTFCLRQLLLYAQLLPFLLFIHLIQLLILLLRRLLNLCLWVSVKILQLQSNFSFYLNSQFACTHCQSLFSWLIFPFCHLKFYMLKFFAFRVKEGEMGLKYK